MSIDGLADDPVNVAQTFAGQAAGTWTGAGALTAHMTFDDGIMTIPVPDTPILVGYSIAPLDATGTFSRTTGAGTLDATLGVDGHHGRPRRWRDRHGPAVHAAARPLDNRQPSTSAPTS